MNSTTTLVNNIFNKQTLLVVYSEYRGTDFKNVIHFKIVNYTEEMVVYICWFYL